MKNIMSLVLIGGFMASASVIAVDTNQNDKKVITARNIVNYMNQRSNRDDSIGELLIVKCQGSSAYGLKMYGDKNQGHRDTLEQIVKIERLKDIVRDNEPNSDVVGTLRFNIGAMGYYTLCQNCIKFPDGDGQLQDADVLLHAIYGDDEQNCDKFRELFNK